MYATAPAPATVMNCSDAGILGPVVGMIGSLQALEAIKVLTGIGCMCFTIIVMHSTFQSLVVLFFNDFLAIHLSLLY